MSGDDPFGVPRRILHVTEAPLGGVATYLDELIAQQLISLPGTEIDVIMPEVNRAALSSLGGPRLHIHGFEQKRGSLRDLAALGGRTIRHIRRTRPEIVHLHSSYAGAVVRGLVPLIPRGTKLIYCPHGWAFSRQGSARMQRGTAMVERLLSRTSDRIICISDHERREALRIGIPAARLVVIDNGVSPHAGLCAPRASQGGAIRLVAFAGRFDRQKGFDTFVEVMRRLEGRAQGVAIGSAIVSDGGLPDLPPNVEILGWQPREKVFELFRRADLLLVPSRWEGFGLVALEAMQARLAVFASRVGGLQDIVVDGRTGRLFTPDAADEIADLILASSDEDLSRYGEEGFRRYADRYTAERMAREVAALYGDLLSE
ncbi:MAG: glycosyltransferase family 4 protein [Paracoccus sp. (in: a-proteobacteria)]